MKREEYSKIEAVNQSLLKALVDGVSPSKIRNTKYYEEFKHFKLGDLVDCLITTPDELNELFYFGELATMPSANVISMVRQLYDMSGGAIYKLDDWPIILQQIINDHNHHIKRHKDFWPHDTRIKSIVKDGTPYLEHLKAANGRTIISKREKDLADLIVNNILTHDHTRSIFQTTPEFNKTFLGQVGLVWEYKGFKCKGLLDLVIIDHDRKVIWPIDIKTTSKPTHKFREAAEHLRYDIQAAWYMHGLRDAKNKGVLKINELQSIDISDYTLVPLSFVVESTTSPGCPLVYHTTSKDLDVGRYGLNKVTYGNGNRIIFPPLEGYEELLETYDYIVNKGGQYNKEIDNQNGRLQLGLWD